jgi:asparagine synthase (glutamine-hydrolysing)
MLTNGFALFKGEGAASLAKDAARRVRRYAREVVVGTDGEFVELDSARLSGGEVALAFSLEKGGLPLVHGYLSGDGAFPEGEFSMLGRGADGFYGTRGPLGTRGLWLVREGKNAGSLSSDYRLLLGGTLLPPGTTYGRTGAREMDPRREEPRGVAPSFEEAAKTLASLVEESVTERITGRGRVAVSFSGGLDSSLLALVASKHAEVVLCSAFARGSRDEGQATKAAALLGLKLETALLDQETLVERSKKAELPPGEATLMDRALWCIFSMTSELAKRRNARTILLGQLADELFGGYRKYAIAAREEGGAAAERMMRDDVRGCADRGFLRDEASCSASCEVRFPYADAGIGSFAARLPLSYKIRDGESKAVLRAAALELGLPEELAGAPKRAAQFSSGAAKLLKGR